MSFCILRKAVKVRRCSMPMVSNKVVESADSPASKDDYIRVKGLRLVGAISDTVLCPDCDAPLNHLLLQVKPYYFDFLCCVKKRWLGMTIIDVFSEVCIL